MKQDSSGFPQQKVDNPPPIPAAWRDAFRDHIHAAASYRLAWRTSTRGDTAWIEIGERRPIKVVEVSSVGSDQTVYAVETDEGHCSPHELADSAWLDCFEIYLEERAKRGGELKQIVVQVEILDREGTIIEDCTKTQNPRKGADPESTSGDDLWIGEAETTDDRRDRNLMREMRRERYQLFGMLTTTLSREAENSEKMLGMVETVAGAFGRAFDVRERAMADEYQRILDLRDGDVDDRRMDRVVGLAETLASKVMHSHGIGVAPASSGGDPLIQVCRELAAEIQPGQWDALYAIDDEPSVFMDLRGVLERACRWDAERPAVFAVCEAIVIEIGVRVSKKQIDPARVIEILGVTTMAKLDSVRELLAD